MTQCPVCDSSSVRQILDIPTVPIFCNVQWDSKADAIAADKGRISLAFCNGCGHLFNADFKPELLEYSPAYENSLHFSPVFHSFAEELANDLIERFDLRNKKVLDIGCGKGEFLALLCEDPTIKGFGFDASFDETRQSRVASKGVTYINDFFGLKYADLKPDFVCCQHVLEHIQNPAEFLSEVRAAIDNSDKICDVYFEVPSAAYSVVDLGVWDLIYEHCSYFCHESLAKVFERSRFVVDKVYTSFKDQFLCVEASTEDRAAAGQQYGAVSDEYTANVSKFERAYAEKLAHWNTVLEQSANNGLSTVVWGAGSKGVTFLNCVMHPASVSAIVDMNPNKKGKFVGGTGHQIITPDALVDDPPDQVIVMNSIYVDEIRDLLLAKSLEPSILVA